MNNNVVKIAMISGHPIITAMPPGVKVEFTSYDGGAEKERDVNGLPYYQCVCDKPHELSSMWDPLFMAIDQKIGEMALSCAGNEVVQRLKTGSIHYENMEPTEKLLAHQLEVLGAWVRVRKLYRYDNNPFVDAVGAPKKEE